MLRSFFIALSTNKAFRAFSERSTMGRRVSRRFVAGMSVEEAIAAAEHLNAEGIEATLDSLGESVMQVSQAEESAAIYHQLLDEIAARKLRANVSVKLTQVGMDIGGHGAGPELAERIVGEMVEHAAMTANFVRIDMEGSDYTEATIAMTERLNARWPGAVGTVLQAYLFRTADDVERLIAQGIRMRLCKGAYKEPAEIAFPLKADVDANYVKLMKRVASSGVFCGIATHDEAIIETMRQFVAQTGLDKRAFEFQMLYGVRRDLQRKLAAEGFGVRVYVPFGTEWYPYFMRRLAERPANVLFLAKNFFRN
ncbi:proline dehydrogenase family protein [Granulicella mallensis]|uniref:proline dehydrogenase n=1 Tax=Granulicella mallensis (strain ATCC BAA-1857 / DSM 23137 / MP5ACTX8) TaxID=682795 RepID=G8NRR5_GRAMM|nr:Proline dehydrogenase [Granulicella mallensis MP5ACTX8]